MTRFVFVGDPAAVDQRSEPERITYFDVVFPRGEPVDVSGMTDAQRGKLAGNNHFRAVPEFRYSVPTGDEGEAATELRPKRPRSPAQLANDARLAARHMAKRGGTDGE